MQPNDHAQKQLDYYSSTYGYEVARHIRRLAEQFANAKGLDEVTLYAVLWGANVAGL